MSAAIIDAYNAAADWYDHPVNSYWRRFSERTLTLLAPRQGARVLDVGCGTGAFSIPAAERVGPRGRVLGVDLADRLLTRAREKAEARRLANVTFECSDFMLLDAAEPFDAVVSVFSVFFVADMAAAAQHLWRLVRPGGTLAITIWGSGVFEPAITAFWRSLNATRPELQRPISPWERVGDSGAFAALLGRAGIADADVVFERGEHVLESAADWWIMVLGSGFRSALDALTVDERERVRADTLTMLRRANALTLTANVIYARARKSPCRVAERDVVGSSSL
jgi:SAM-dependent methyltransferase